MGKAQLHREWATTSNRSKKNKSQQDLRFKILKIRAQRCPQPDEAASYVHNSKPRKAELKAAASGWARGAITTLRAQVLSKRANRNSKPGGAVSAKKFKNGYDAENNITSGAMFQKRKRRFQSDYSFKDHRIVSGDSVTLIHTGKCDSENDDSLKGPVGVGHTQTETYSIAVDSEDKDVPDPNTDENLFDINYVLKHFKSINI
jgi:hypothetical protein